jgi:peptidoglycan/xylan/chitin deacetylase (PgdA/CDA1 family)
MHKLFIAFFICILSAWSGLPPAQADGSGSRFVAIAFHDVVDDRRDLGDDAMTTGTLIEFFEWLKANNWTAVSADDVLRAARGERPLPPRAILITFDDGYRSLYTRVFPLLLAYRIPVVSALVGTWMDAPMEATVDYDGRIVPRRNFISWAEAREMQATGLVEFGSHSYNLHRGVTGNPQGNVMPSAVTREFKPGTGYENAASHRARLEADARRIHALLQRELGRAPRIWIWPYGRYSEISIEAVRTAGFTMALTLDAGPGETKTLMSIPRQYPGADAALSTLTSMVRLQDKLPTVRRLLCLDPGELWTGSPESTDERLGRAIERLRIVGSTAVVVDAVGRNTAGQVSHAWFPTDALPVKADILSRIVWQLQTRAGVEVHVRVPGGQTMKSTENSASALTLFRDLGASVPLSGLFIDDAPALARLAPAETTFAGQPWETRTARDRIAVDSLQPPERMAIQAFREVQRFRPWANLTLVTDEPNQISGIADLTLQNIQIPADGKSPILSSDQKLQETVSRRSGIWLTGQTPPAPEMLRATSRRYQRLGGTALGWCPDSSVADLPIAREVEPDVSAATFPVRF